MEAKTISKGSLVLFALRKFAVASDATLTDVEPQSIADGLEDLEDMMADWELKSIKLGYLFSTDEEPVNPGDDSGLIPGYKSGVGYQLMLRMMSDYSIEPTPRQEANAALAFDSILTATLHVPSMPRLGNMPTGQGNKYSDSDRYYPGEQEPVNGDNLYSSIERRR